MRMATRAGRPPLPNPPPGVGRGCARMERIEDERMNELFQRERGVGSLMGTATCAGRPLSLTLPPEGGGDVHAWSVAVMQSTRQASFRCQQIHTLAMATPSPSRGRAGERVNSHGLIPRPPFLSTTAIIEVSVNHDSDLLPFGLSSSKPGGHSDRPFDKLRANGSFVMLNGKRNRQPQETEPCAA
jgi:hypothetical protein